MSNNDKNNQVSIAIDSNNRERMIDENNNNFRIKDKNDINDFKSTHVEVKKIYFFLQVDYDSNNTLEVTGVEPRENPNPNKGKIEKLTWDIKLLYSLPAFGKMSCLLILR